MNSKDDAHEVFIDKWLNRVEDDRLIVIIIKVGDRREVYRNL